MEEVQGAGLAGAEPVVIDRPTIPAAGAWAAQTWARIWLTPPPGPPPAGVQPWCGSPIGVDWRSWGRDDDPSQLRAVDVAAMGAPARAREGQGRLSRGEAAGRR